MKNTIKILSSFIVRLRWLHPCDASSLLRVIMFAILGKGQNHWHDLLK